MAGYRRIGARDPHLPVPNDCFKIPELLSVLIVHPVLLSQSGIGDLAALGKADAALKRAVLELHAI